MPVLIEAISVVIRRKAINDKYPGGYLAFEQDAPMMGPVDTLCADDDLVRIGFMSPFDVKTFCDRLGSLGIGSPEKPVDLAIIDQITSAVTPCDWIETTGFTVEDGGPVLVARLVGSTDETLFVPEHWSWADSITKNCFFVPSSEVEATFAFVRMGDDGLEVWRDKASGELRYIGRPTDPLIALSQRVQA